jgi:hypothetical protein
MEVFVPGRLCILGEHTDWAGEYREDNRAISYGRDNMPLTFHKFVTGMAIVCTTNEGLYAKCSRWKAGYLRFQCSTENFEEQIFECDVFGSDELKVSDNPDTLISGVSHEIMPLENCSRRVIF